MSYLGAKMEPADLIQRGDCFLFLFFFCQRTSLKMTLKKIPDTMGYRVVTNQTWTHVNTDKQLRGVKFHPTL